MRNLLLALSLLILSACVATGITGGSPSSPPDTQATLAPSAPAAAPAPAPVLASSRPVKVAILLPLSGAQAALGKSLQHGAELAVMELGGERFELMPRDSGASASQAVEAAKDAIAAGAELIIGPLFSNSVEAVKPVAAAARVPVLALSNDWKVAGSGVYVIGFSPVEQVRRIAAFAASRSLREIGVIAPASPYGDLALAAMKEPGSGVDVVAVARYQNNAASIAAAAEAMAGQRSQYRALFIPEGGEALHRVAAQLAARGLTAQALPLLGTGLWDDETIGAEPALVGGWYAAPENDAQRAFVDRYQKNFGDKPARLASLAYDATALAVTLAGKPVEVPFSETALTNPNGFAGLDGIFRLTLSGMAEHGFAVMEVTKDGPQTLDSSPKRF